MIYHYLHDYPLNGIVLITKFIIDICIYFLKCTSFIKIYEKNINMKFNLQCCRFESYFGSDNGDRRRVGIANLLHAILLPNPVRQSVSQNEMSQVSQL